MLLARPGELVTREELQKKLWPADTFVDFDRSLNAAVKRLRAALGDSAETPGSSKRWRAEVTVSSLRSMLAGSAAAESPASSPSSTEVVPNVESAPRPSLRPRHFLWIALVAVGMTSLGLTLYLGKVDGWCEDDDSGAD